MGGTHSKRYFLNQREEDERDDLFGRSAGEVWLRVSLVEEDGSAAERITNESTRRAKIDRVVGSIILAALNLRLDGGGVIV